MGSFAEGFIRGFAGTMATDIQTRRQEARDYFNKQVEVARTTGVQNRQRVVQAVGTSVSIAKQLSQMGVPKEVVMAVANQNPEGLGDFYKQVAELEAAGSTIDKDLFDSVMTVGGNFQAPDEDFQTFFSRMYEPIKSAAAADPESFNNDKKGSIFAAMFGLNAMDSARDRLGRTEIADGMTAQQLLDYGDNVTPNKVGGDAIVTFDFEKIAELTDETNKTSAATLNAIKEQVDTEFGTQLGLLEAKNANAEAGDAANLNTKQAALTTYNLIANSPYATLVAPDVILDFVNTAIRRNGGEATLTAEDLAGASETPVEGPPDTSGSGGSTGEEEASTEAPTAPVTDAPIDPRKEPNLVTFQGKLEGKVRTLTLIQDNGDGTSTYMDENGDEFSISNKVVRTLVKP